MGTTTTTNRATGTPAPGFGVDIDDYWELPDYDAINAGWPAVSTSVRSEYNDDHDNKSHGGTGTPTGGGHGGTSSSPTDLPTLTHTPTMPGPYTGTECKSYTTTRQCVGDGAHSACSTATLCVPTAACPPAYTASGTPSCPDDDQLCLRTTIYTRCAKVTGRGVIGIDLRTATTTGSPAVEATPEPEPKIRPRSEPLLPVPDTKPELEADFNSNSDSDLDSILLSNQSSTSLNQLFARQNGCGGSANGGCDYIPFCDLCATIIKVPCVKASIDAITGPLSGTDIQVVINEDGKDVCVVELNCSIWDSDCSGLVDVKCGDKYTMSFKYNYVVYYSPKYDETFPLYLERDKTDDFIFCTQPFGLIDVPSGCLEDTFSIENGPCKSKKREAPTFPSIDGFGDGLDGLWATTPEDEHMTPLNFSLEHNILNARAFSDFGTDPTGCSAAQSNKLKLWVDDVVVMTQAAIDAIGDLQTASYPYNSQVDNIASTMNNLLGIDYATGTNADWKLLKDHFTAVRDFANGVFPHGQAWIFCGDHFAVPQQWGDWVRDANNQLIPAPPNQNGQQNGHLQLYQVGAYQIYYNHVPQWQPYRIPAIGNYVFHTPGGFDPGQPGVRAGAICSRNNKNPVAVTMHSSLGFPIITVCSPMNKRNLDGFTVFPNDVISQVQLRNNVGLDQHRPGSATLLHEFMHAVRGQGNSPDKAGNSQSCWQASISAPSDARNSPECATLFAVAMYFQRASASSANPQQFTFLRALDVV
ncbi:hypothetical protein F4803DRAFT_528881 [Xylaria telfairii]|nr:hypothetical protein F4803DRAFT_528881 [Xylaria telfairii]